MKNLDICKQKFVAKEFQERYPCLKKLELCDYEEISGIIGIDNIWVFENSTTLKARYPTDDMPLGIRCPLGDYVIGTRFSLKKIYKELKGDNPKLSTNYTTHYSFHQFSVELTEHEKKELAVMEQEVLSLESNIEVELDDREEKDRKIALDKMKLIRKIENLNQYEAPLLWKDNDVVLDT